MSQPTEARLVMEGPRPYLQEIERVLQKQDIESWIVAPPEGCGNG